MTQILQRDGPGKRYTFARPFLQRLAVGDDGLFELVRTSGAPLCRAETRMGDSEGLATA
jgi:hypothetical protein